MNQLYGGLNQVIHGEDGYVDRYERTKIMGLFGAPVAHEDDVNRACRAALAMQRYLHQFDESLSERTGLHLQVQMAINFGLVFVGGIGSESPKDYSVLGKTVEFAISLESNAVAGSILVSKNVV